MAEVTVVGRLAAENNVLRHDEARMRNYEMAQLVAAAHHAPDKIPAFKPTGDETSPSGLPQELQDEIDDIRGRAFLRAVSVVVSN